MWLTHLLDLTAPAVCAHCDSPTAGALKLCVHCLHEVPTRPSPVSIAEPLAAAWALAPYNGPVGSLVRKAKQGDPDQLGLLCQRMAPQVPSVGEAVTWVPSPLGRHLKRGFDPAQVIAQTLARTHGVPCLRLLKRTEATPQASRSRAQRLRSIRGAFAAVQQHAPETLSLVDDVITTGATLSTCGDELMCMGAKHIVGVGLAVSISSSTGTRNTVSSPNDLPAQGPSQTGRKPPRTWRL